MVIFEFESPFHNACPSLLAEECRKLNRLANKFHCVSLTQLLHSYAIPGNSSKLERATCRNPGRHCGQHKFCYIYSHRGYVNYLIWFYFGSTSVWRLELHYDKLIIDTDVVLIRTYIDTIGTLVQNASVHRNAPGIARRVFLTIFTKFVEAVNSETPL